MADDLKANFIQDMHIDRWMWVEVRAEARQWEDSDMTLPPKEDADG